MERGHEGLILDSEDIEIISNCKNSEKTENNQDIAYHRASQVSEGSYRFKESIQSNKKIPSIKVYILEGMFRRRFLTLFITILILSNIIFLVLYFNSIKYQCINSFNSVYPLNDKLYKHQAEKYGRVDFKVYLVSDEDKASRIVSNSTGSVKWISYLRNATVSIFTQDFLNHPNISVTSKHNILESKISYDGRGMELSDLVVYDGRLMTVDDRTGVVYEISKSEKVYPRYILSDGPGNMTKGFKGEWTTVKDDDLYIGGMGREYIVDGTIQNYNNCYLSHEAVSWDHCNRRWCFLPRRASKIKYSEDSDLISGTNIFICVNEEMTSYSQVNISSVEQEQGFSAFRFVPFTDCKLIAAVKTHEVEEGSLIKNKSFLWLFDIFGKVYHENVEIGEGKFEGLEFI